jgi:hydrogenase maturation protease
MTRPDEAQTSLRLTGALQRDGRSPIVVIGCGRSYRQDDQIGLRIAERLQSQDLPDTQVFLSEAPGPDLLDLWTGAELLILADAARSAEDAPPGTWRQIVWQGSRRPEACSPLSINSRLETSSAHWLGLTEALELGRNLGDLPPDVWIYAVAARDFGYGVELSAAAERAIDQVTGRIRADVDGWRRAHGQISA